MKVIGTRRTSRPDALGLAYQGLFLGEVQCRQPSSGTLVLVGDRPSKVKLAGKYKEVRRIVEGLRGWTNRSTGDAPPVVLNKQLVVDIEGIPDRDSLGGARFVGMMGIVLLKRRCSDVQFL